jgi:predicted amidohydrolase YtcJ
MVMPGIHEGHIHQITDPDQPSCDMGGGSLTVAEFLARVQACLDDPRFHTGAPGAADDFLIVDNLYWQFLRPAGAVPTKDVLANLQNPHHRPIVVNAAVTGHNIAVNQEALDLAGITASTPNPVGGRIATSPTASRTAFCRMPPTILYWTGCRRRLPSRSTGMSNSRATAWRHSAGRGSRASSSRAFRPTRRRYASSMRCRTAVASPHVPISRSSSIQRPSRSSRSSTASRQCAPSTSTHTRSPSPCARGDRATRRGPGL